MPKEFTEDDKRDILNYFKAQLCLLIDISHNNPLCMESLLKMFPVKKILENVSCEKLGIQAKAGLLRVFLCLLSNSGTLAYVEKPQLQRSWSDDKIKMLKAPPDFVAYEILEGLKKVILAYSSLPINMVDDKLQYEYLRVLTFLMNYDLILGSVKTKVDFAAQLKESYKLLSSVFKYCCSMLDEIVKSKINFKISENKTGTATAVKLDEITEESWAEKISDGTEGKAAEEIIKAEYYLKYPMKYLHIFNSLANMDKFDTSDASQQLADDAVIEEGIFAFLYQLILNVEDAWLTAFTEMFRRCYYTRRNGGSNKDTCKQFILQLYNRGKSDKKDREAILPEVEDALEYKDIKKLYEEWKLDNKGRVSEDEDELLDIFIKMMANSNNFEQETQLFNLIIGYKLPKASFFLNIESLYLIMDEKTQVKQEKLTALLPQMTACINQANLWLNVSDIKNLQQSSASLHNFRDLLEKFYSLFSENNEDYGKSMFEGGKTRFKKIVKQDAKFKTLLLKLKRKANRGDPITEVVVEFLKISAKAKKAAADNVLDGSDNLGMHAVSFSKEVLGLIDLCNDILITFCENTPKAKMLMLKHIAKIKPIPPRLDGDKKKWLLHSQLLESDITLFTEIVKGNDQMANLNNQQVRILKEVVTVLNLSISEFNINTIFYFFENILNLTTHEELYNLVLSYFWQNRTRIEFESILQSIARDPKEANLEKQLQLLKAVLFMGQSDYLKKAKNKLREMFPYNHLSIAFHKIMPLYDELEKPLFLEILKYLVEIFDVLYLKGKQRDEEVLFGFSTFFIDQQKGVENEMIKHPMHVYLLAEIYNLLNDYESACKKLKTQSTRILQNNLKKKLVDKLRDFQPKESSKDLANAIKAVKAKFDDSQSNGLRGEDAEKHNKPGENDKTMDEESKGETAGLLDKSRELSKAQVNEDFDKIREELQMDPEIGKHLDIEANEFYNKIMRIIQDCDEQEETSAQKKASKNDKGRLQTKFIEKLIHYIGNSGRIYIKPRILKLLIRTFIRVIDMAGEEGKSKASQNRILMTLDRLGLTKTLLTLLCSDESEILDSVFPHLIKLANKLLTNANPEIQERFYKGFSEMHSEKLFERLYSAINKNIFIHQRHPNTLFNIMKVHKHKAFLSFNFQEQILKFLKALCENHFEKLQGFIARPAFLNTQQQYNMLELVVQYLGVLVAELKDLGKKKDTKKKINVAGIANAIPEQANEIFQYRKTCIFKQCIASLRALSEAVQGPHKENQQIISDTNFFNIATQILEIAFNFTDPDPSKECALKDFELSRLKDECAIMLLSIMEQRLCRDDKARKNEDEIVTKMRQSIKEELISQNIVEVYYAFEQECELDYSEDVLFEHLEKDKDDITNSFVLELGFNLLFILRRWYDGCTNNADETESTDIFVLLWEKYGIGVVHKRLVQTKEAYGRTGLPEDDLLSSILNFGKDFYGGFVDIGKRAAKIMKRREYKSLSKNEDYQSRAFKLFQQHSGSLEIVRNKTIETVYFPVLPYIEALSEEQKSLLFENMPIGQQKAKLVYVIENSSEFIQEMTNEYMFAKFFKNFPVLGAVSRALPLWKTLGFYLSIMLNLVMLFSFHTTGDGYDDRYTDPNIYEWHTNVTIRVLGALLLSLSLVIVVAFLFKYSLKVINRVKMEQAEEERKEKIEEAREKTGLIVVDLVSKKAMFVWKIFSYVVLNPLFLYHVGYLAVSFIGVFYHPFFFAFHIITVILWFPKLTSLLRAIWGTSFPMLLTLVLFFIFEYAFAVIAYRFYHDDFDSNEDYLYSCSTLMNCFWTIFDQTFKNNGGVGAFLRPTYNIDGQWVTFRFGRWIFDFLFNFMIVMLVTQLLQGLIINKFGDLRDRQNELDEDLEKECIICGDSKETINRNRNQTFKDHIKGVHAIWNYYMFIGYLKRKPTLEHTGIESYAYFNYNKKSIEWLPFALFQSAEEETNIEQLGGQVDDIIKEINGTEEDNK